MYITDKEKKQIYMIERKSKQKTPVKSKEKIIKLALALRQNLQRRKQVKNIDKDKGLKGIYYE